MLEKIALKKKLITIETCEKAIKECKGAPHYELALKEYFVSNRLISPKHMNQLVFTLAAVQTIQKNARFGKIAVHMGFVDESALKEALSVQKKSASNNKKPKMIGQILIDNGRMTREQVIKVFEAQKTEKKKAEAAVERRTSPEKKETAQTDYSLKQELSCGLVIEIDPSGMNAFLRKTATFQDDLQVEDVINILSEKMIQSGIVVDEMITGFLRSSGFREKKFNVAKGKAMIQGTDARVEYLFDADYLKAGGMDDKGTIDFKERGEIPLVEAGTLLAEKIPMVGSRDGKDIFGQILSAQPARDIGLNSRNGTRLSEDGNRLYAAVSGYPELSESGEINVHETFVVQGDVAYETGHIIYKGDIEVKGSVKSGFRIKGRRIIVSEIDGGEIFAMENVLVLNGINEGQITSFGNVHAKFVHQAEISCLGNLSVDKEIVDTKVKAGGFCKIESGEIINSRIAANRGVFVKHLGTEKSNPNTIRLERNPFIEKKIKEAQAGIEAAQKELEILAARRTRLSEKLDRYGDLSTGLYHKCEMVYALLKNDEDSRQRLKDSPSADGQSHEQEDRAARQGKIRLKTLEEELDDALTQVQFYKKAILELDVTEQTLNRKIEDLQIHKTGMEAYDLVNKTEPVVEVNGTIFPETLIQGPHSHKKILEKQTRVKIMECQVVVDESKTTTHEFLVRDL